MSGCIVNWRGKSLPIPPEIENESAEVTLAYEVAGFAKLFEVAPAQIEAWMQEDEKVRQALASGTKMTMEGAKLSALVQAPEPPNGGDA